MKIAVGLRNPAEILDREYLRFLRQVGVTHVIVFMPQDPSLIPSAAEGCWSLEDLSRIKGHLAENGLVMEGIENFVPAHWDQVLLDGPGRSAQMDKIKRTVANIGRAGIPNMGYNFSIAGVIGPKGAPDARAGAMVAVFDPDRFPLDETPIPLGFAWNTVIDPNAPAGTIGRVPMEVMRDRLYRFLEEVLPVAEENGVRLVAHPEDPPLREMRGVARVLTRPEAFDELFARFPTRACGVEFCQGTFTEMGVDVYRTIEHFASEGRIGYVHMRNVRGNLKREKPYYAEVMVDEGDVDMARAFLAYHKGGYEGAFIPDHYPGLASAPTNHAAVAYCVGYLRGLLHALKIPVWGD